MNGTTNFMLTKMVREGLDFEDALRIAQEPVSYTHLIRRLKDGICSIDTGVVFLDVLNNAERISDHCSNIAVRMAVSYTHLTPVLCWGCLHWWARRPMSSRKTT